MKNFQKTIDFSKNLWYNSLRKMHLGVAQLVARYLGVVEAASSSLVTQTKKRRRVGVPNCSVFSFISSQNLLKSRFFVIISTGTFFPAYWGECACFLATTTC